MDNKTVKIIKLHLAKKKIPKKYNIDKRELCAALATERAESAIYNRYKM